jgi:phage shock protein PspC (stress-responsive transcriptional regulator)
VEDTNMKKLYRSKKYRVIGGVCGGLAEYLDVDVTIVRLATVVLAFMVPNLVLLYIIAWIVMPEAPDYIVSASQGQPSNRDEKPEAEKAGAPSALSSEQTSQTAAEIVADDIPGQRVCEEGPEEPIANNGEGTHGYQQEPVKQTSPPTASTPLPKQETAPRNKNREFLGYFLIVLGILALLKKYMPQWWRLPFTYIRMWWPVVIIALGIAFVITAFRGGK